MIKMVQILSAYKTVLITSITIAYTLKFCHTDFEHTWNLTNILNLELCCFFSKQLNLQFMQTSSKRTCDLEQ